MKSKMGRVREEKTRKEKEDQKEKVSEARRC